MVFGSAEKRAEIPTEKRKRIIYEIARCVLGRVPAEIKKCGAECIGPPSRAVYTDSRPSPHGGQRIVESESIPECRSCAVSHANRDRSLSERRETTTVTSPSFHATNSKQGRKSPYPKAHRDRPAPSRRKCSGPRPRRRTCKRELPPRHARLAFGSSARKDAPRSPREFHRTDSILK